MRGLLRHVATLRNKPTAVDVNDTSAWRAYVVAQYRVGAAVKDKVWRLQRLGVVVCVRPKLAAVFSCVCAPLPLASVQWIRW